MKSSLKVIMILCVAGLVFCGCGAKGVQERAEPGVRGDVLLRVYVVRHGESYKNVPHPADMPEEKVDSLTPRGLRQAAAAAKLLKGKGVVAVIASPTGRTRQTAGVIAKTLGLKEQVATDEAFASIKAGTTPEDEPVTWVWRKKQWAAGRDPRPEGGESLTDGVARAVEAIDQLAKKYPGQAVVIVSHGDICAGLLGEAENVPITERYAGEGVQTGSVNGIIITSAGWKRTRI